MCQFTRSGHQCSPAAVQTGQPEALAGAWRPQLPSLAGWLWLVQASKGLLQKRLRNWDAQVLQSRLQAGMLQHRARCSLLRCKDNRRHLGVGNGRDCSCCIVGAGASEWLVLQSFSSCVKPTQVDRLPYVHNRVVHESHLKVCLRTVQGAAVTQARNCV